MPVTGIVGYPPSIGPDETVDQIRSLWAAGWRRFKLPIAPTPDASIARLRAAREAFPDAWLGIDNNFYSKTAADAIAFGRRLDGLSIGWFEDIVPPGDAAMVARDPPAGSRHPWRWATSRAGRTIRRRSSPSTPSTCSASMPPRTAGSPGCGAIVESATRAGTAVAPHMFPHVH